VNQIANMLLNLSMKKHEHLAIYLPNCIEYAYLYHALSKTGIVMVPLNQFLRGESLRYIVEHSDSKYLITSRQLFEEKIAPLQNQLPAIKHVLFIDEIAASCQWPSILFSEFTACSTEFTAPQPVLGGDLQGIWYTSGTTGLPKGVATTQCAFVFRALFYADYFRMQTDDVVYYVLPQYHVAYMVFGGPLAMAAGCEIVQVDWFSASRFWSDIKTYGVSMTFSTGTILPVMLAQEVSEAEQKAQQHLRLWMGWPVDDPDAIKKRWPGIKFLELYGTTEAGNATICDYDQPQLGTAGPAAPYTDLEIINSSTGALLPPGQVGEIKVRHKLGPDYILKGYYKDPQKTSETLRDGFWHSGDMGMIDENGCLRFMARIKDYLRVGGENVSTRLVEQTIVKHPSIAETAVVGTRNELGHDELVAHLVLKPGQTLEPIEFFKFCNQQMPYFMVPRFFQLQKELPKTATLRIEKYKLQEADLSQAIDRKQLPFQLQR